MAKELTREQKKDWAKILYLKERLSQIEISQRVGISKQTICKWVKDEKWEKLRASNSITREEQLANLYQQLAEINEAIAGRPSGEKYSTSKEADSINKIAAAIEKLEKETGLSEIISVSKGFLEWLRKSDPAKAKELSDYFDAYIKDCLR